MSFTAAEDRVSESASVMVTEYSTFTGSPSRVNVGVPSTPTAGARGLNTFTNAMPGVRLLVCVSSVTQNSTPRTNSGPCVALKVTAFSASSYWALVPAPVSVNVLVAASQVPVIGLSSGAV